MIVLQFHIPCRYLDKANPSSSLVKGTQRLIGLLSGEPSSLDIPHWTNILFLSMACSLKNYYLFARLGSFGNMIGFQRCPVSLLNNVKDGDVIVVDNVVFRSISYEV